MGVVYLAEDPRLNRQVAIKTVELALEDGQQRDFFRNRLLRDAQAAAALSHPNIVSVYDVVEETASAYVVMEFVDGESLAARLRRVGRPEPSFVFRVLREMASALDYTHARGIIHRDIKPGNVMIDSAGRAKIMDFGIARIADTRTNTPTGLVMGTIHYMAPEQIKGEPLDGRCDQFALGAVAYEMLTGATMFGAQSLATLAYKIVNEDPPLMRSLNGELPESMDSVIRKALAKQPAQRFPNCSEFVKALEAAFAGQPVAFDVPVREAPTQTMSIPAGALQPLSSTSVGTAAASAPVVPPAAVVPAARRPWIAVLAAGGALAIAVGAVAIWKPWAEPHPQPAADAPATPSHAPQMTPAPPPAPAEPAVGRSAPRREPAIERSDVTGSKPERKQAPPPPEAKSAPAAEESEPDTVGDDNTMGPALEAWKQGNQLEAAGDHAGAIAAYTKAISLKPRYAAAYTNRGLAHFRQNDFAGAAADYSHAIDILPKYAHAYVLRGNARAQLHQPDLALSDYSRAIELKPDLAAAWGGRGVVHLHQSQFQKALADLNKAVELAPRREIWYQNRAAVRRQLGDEAGAAADMQQAHRLEARKGEGN
jgi:Flp pilus assembly protein TadD